MRRTLFQLLACFILGLSISGVVAQSPSPWGQTIVEGPGVVLLKHDTFHVGFVRQVGGQVQIELADNAKVTHALSQIEFVGRDLEEVYQHKRQKHKRLEVGDHFQLTRWCIRAGLLEHAAEHYLEVNRVAANHPRVKQLGMELRDKILSDNEFRKFAGLPLVPAPTIESPSDPAVMQASGMAIQNVGTESTLSLHPLVVAQYTERIQPILINRCSQAACHGFSSNNRLKLFDPKGRNASRVTAENLRQVVELISHKDPMETELIKKATHVHSTQQVPGISPSESGLLFTLQAWISFAKNPVVTANGQQPLSSALIAAQNPMASPLSNSHVLTPVAPGSVNLRSVPHAPGPNGNPLDSGFQPPAASEIDQLDARLRQILGEPPAPQSGVAPSDPFDPAIFNRQVRQQQTSPANR